MNEDSLEREFLQRALRRADLLRRDESKRANREYDKLHEIKERMRLLADRGEAALKRISRSPDVDVQIFSAACLLAIDEPYASGMLERIANSGVGLPSVTAAMTLREWKSGSLSAFWG